MCGIAGLISKDGRPADRAALAAMRAALAHRGPDGGSDYLDGTVGFAHTRLAIIDLEGGDQPLIGPKGGALVGNGEIYNYVELRAEQQDRVAHRTATDFEPALVALEAEGLSGLDRLRGMYALALHRRDGNDVLIARDPFGIKPLYCHEADDRFAFASEPRALFAAGLLRPRIRTAKRQEFLQLQYTIGPETVFEDVRRIMPGEALRLTGGAVAERLVRDPIPEPAGAGPTGLDAAVARFDATFENSVTVHQRSDVPYGMFLSGGLDSAALLTMMARLNDRPVRTFTCGFSGTGVHDERQAARRIADSMGAEHTEVDFGEDDFWTLLPAIAAAFDEPTADYAVLPTYKLGQVARRSVKVVLSGEGGDEMLAGYGRYRIMLRPWWRGGKRPHNRGNFQGMGVLRDDRRDWVGAIDEIRRAAPRPGWSPLQAAQATDIRAWLNADLLLKLDRCLMAHGIEGRTPFLDPEMARFAFHLPDELKVANDLGKWVLRNWLAKHCPAADAFERKRGFTVPVGDWIARRGGELGPLVAAQPAIAEIARPDRVAKLFVAPKGRHARAAWTLLFYALWHKHHIEGAPVAPDVFEALAQ